MLIDTHCHLDFADFEEERDALVKRAHDAGVKQMVTISTRVAKLPALLALTERYPSVFCSVGTHPNNANEELEIGADDLVRLAETHEKVVAIGECGLDYFYDTQTPEDQKTGFLRHIEASRRTQLPLVIHSRSADDDMGHILRDETAKGAFPFILHCFSAGVALAKTGVELGGYISFSGILTFPKSQELRDIAKEIPLDRLLVETDAPYLAPKRWRGKRNEPSYVVNTAEVLAEVKGVSYADIAAITTDNALRLFSKMPRL
ncbi:YchF/TatD family DNA exonuclease [Agrobacterium vitis]|uniref:TatD family hydrolase n=1 Tax=Rhizobium/Agrobacterium group TaxID=227290 RepID=UPI0008DC22B7|nr:MULTISPECIES: TatD family hydrolase [Rhizobium/Agrobacterium group]MCF1435274.1 TatD family deoxyribonuclease [Allorhizobium ampelinum]MUO89886.1 YchF/TatD family DNA exonuclease [Agrobacterium vitis]MUZ53177.1 YchF/TatD family DNA exonuclease [Agrobacterium vitis]MUZ91396.1 YchF/TatD family DNA exonuclease [Agrobacterium vitis]MVA40160.1 YchF/TatD family DNA exonuclease [Agrobacterium vitis]